MKITNEPLVPDEPVKFIVTGFPDEDAIKNSLERFYAKAAHADRRFEIYNFFKELIIKGSSDSAGKINALEHIPRPK